MGKTKDLTKRLLTKALGVTAMFAAALFMFSSIALQAEAATAKVTASSARIRKEASTSSDVVGSAANGESFTIQSEVTGSDGYVWYKISVDGATGYIRSDLAQKSDSGSTTIPTTSNTEVTEVQPISAKVTGAQVRVRPDASTNGSVVTTVSRDTVVTVNGTAEGADNRTWYQVNFRSGNDDITGFIREDFLELAGELVPVTEEVPETPNVEEPTVEVPETPTVKVKDYETFETDGKWYLVNNTTSPAYQYVIEDVFKAAETNAALYEDSLKTVKTQKVFIIILVLLLVAGGIGATLIIFKMKDMLDEAYYEEVEKEVAGRQQNKQQNVMHTVGKDSVQKKPTVNGQQRPVGKVQPTGGQPKPMPKQQPGSSAPKPGQAQAAGSQPKQTARPQQAPQTRPAGAGNVQPRTAGTAPHPRSAGASSMAPELRNTAPQQRPGAVSQQRSAGTSSMAPQPNVAARSQAGEAQKTADAAKKQEWKGKNFLSEDDDFEYDFLNWDGDEEI